MNEMTIHNAKSDTRLDTQFDFFFLSTKFLSSADVLIMSATYGASVLSRTCLFERHAESRCQRLSLGVHANAFLFFQNWSLFPVSVFIIITNNERWVQSERIKQEEVKTCSSGADVADGTALHL